MSKLTENNKNSEAIIRWQKTDLGFIVTVNNYKTPTRAHLQCVRKVFPSTSSEAYNAPHWRKFVTCA